MNIALLIDHTTLKPDATRAAVRKLCEEAKQYGFASVCVNSCHAGFVSELLSGSSVLTCVVVGFPLGAMSTAAKAFEAAEAVRQGAGEIDMVINIGAIKDGRWEDVERDIQAVVEASHPAAVKVIIETCLLTEDEKVRACQISVRAGAAFVKTSTGFSTAGATAEDVVLMKNTVAGRAKVKASGGIRTINDVKAMVEAGADRIGTSNGVALIK